MGKLILFINKPVDFINCSDSGPKYVTVLGRHEAIVEGDQVSFETDCYYFDTHGHKVELHCKVSSTVAHAKAKASRWLEA